VQIIADLANGVPVPQKNPLWWHQNTILKNLVQIMASSFFRKFLQLGRLCQKVGVIQLLKVGPVSFLLI